MNSGLLAAAEQGNTTAALFLLDKGVDINMQTNSKSTALMWAEMNRHDEITYLLK